MDLQVIFTEHSLFNVDLFSIDCILNKILQITLSDIDHVICVSNSCKENVIRRVNKGLVVDDFLKKKISSIPNALDSSKFQPDFYQQPLMKNSRLNVIMLSRLVYRKGIDLAVKLIPKICKAHPDVDFIIGGDGPKRVLLERMVCENNLQNRIELLGAISHPYQARNLLTRGHLFLNCSVTESFCISLVEAASCGLQVISTGVGGVPEVLPDSMVRLTLPNVDHIEKALSESINSLKSLRQSEGDNHETNERIRRQKMHTHIATMYSWSDVAMKTEAVYNLISRQSGETRLNDKNGEKSYSFPTTILSRLKKYLHTGLIVAPFAIFVVVSIQLLHDFYAYFDIKRDNKNRENGN